MIADTTCNPDQALTQARRLVHQEKVHLIIGPLCGHEGPAVAQVSKETGIPAGHGSRRRRQRHQVGAARRPWCAPPSSASQIGHPFGDYLYKELGARNVTFIAQDYTWGHEVALGTVETFKAAGGKVAKIIWNPIGTKDYGPTIASIDPGSDAVVAVVVGADRIRLFEAWFSFGMDKKFKIYGGYWMHQDVLPQMDDRAIGMIGNSLHYAAGLDTPENKTFVDAFATSTSGCRRGSPSRPTPRACGPRPRSIRSTARSRTRRPSSRRCARVEIKAPRGPLKLDAYDNPIQNVYISKIQKIKHPVLGEVMTNVPVKTYPAVSQFWTWTPEEFLKQGPYKR